MKRLSLILIVIAFCATTFAQDKKQAEVTAVIEQLRKAMIDGDSATLDKLTDADLTYGHSLGKLENKQQFVHALASGESDFETMDISDQTVMVKNKVAIVRHKIAANIKENGKMNAVKLAVIYTFHKDNKQWKLLARQAIRLQS